MVNLPTLDEPAKYRGLFVFDFGEWAALGYTAEEIAVLLDSADYGGGKVYRIQRVTPDGHMQLHGVSRERFLKESGIFFRRRSITAARADFADLREAAEHRAPPCRATLHLADCSAPAGQPHYVTALIYPADYEDDIGRWLVALDYGGGDVAEGGPSHVTNYQDQTKTILERQQLWSAASNSSRSATEVLANVRHAVQR